MKDVIIAVDIKKKLTPEIIKKIDLILDNVPE